MNLSITADDFGYCPRRNAAISEVFQAGVITDTSLLVNANYAQEAATTGQKIGIPMGLHFNMSEGKPLSPPEQISSIVSDDHLFLGKEGTLDAALRNKIHPNHVKIELSLQIKKFKELTGYYPKRVDGHQHVHVFPVIREAFGEVLQSFKIRLTRIPKDLSLPYETWFSPEIKPFLVDVARFAEESAVVFLKSTALFIGCTLMNFNRTKNFTTEHFNEVISCLPNNTGSCELMVHPGFPCEVEDGGCGAGPDDFSREECRKWEVDTLLSKDFSKLLSVKDITLKGFEHIM